MADDLLTLAEMAVINDQNVSDIEVSDIFDDAPLLRALAAETASNGTSHKYLKQTGAPVVGFRAVNAGRDHDVTEDTLVTADLKILDASFHVDAKLADIYKRGPEAYIAREARRHLRQAFKEFEEQVINGTGNDAGGFNGFTDSAQLDGLADAMVIGAGGTTGALTSVYMIRSTSDLMDCYVVLGEDGNIMIGESFLQFVEAAGGQQKFPAYMTQIDAWVGLAIGGAKSVGRLANVDDGSNKLTDDLLSNLFELFPEEAPPNLIAMNKRSRRQLQQQRTATSPSGQPAPWPTSWEGLPIISTSSLGVAETQVT